MIREIAALYVKRGGAYWDLPGVDPWDETRDARRYPGPHPVIAHPPCARWCRLAGLVEARWGHKKGEDGGTFEAALAAVEKYGGVLEHPAYSDAWAVYGLPVPPGSGGWQQNLFRPGWACYVEQGRYGHPAKKATWLYAVGTDLPELAWGHIRDQDSWAYVSWCANHVPDIWAANRTRVGKESAAATPPAFRDVLLEMARSVGMSRANTGRYAR
jgi:hypothetical protein